MICQVRRGEWQPWVIRDLKATVVPRSRPGLGDTRWSQERRLLGPAAVVAPSSTGWQACPAFVDTSVPRVSLQWRRLCWRDTAPPLPVLMHSPVLPHLCAHRGAHASHFLRKSGNHNSPDRRTGTGLMGLISFPPRHQPHGPGGYTLYSRRD